MIPLWTSPVAAARNPYKKNGSYGFWSDELILCHPYSEGIIKNTQLSQGVNVKKSSHFCDISDRGGCSAEMRQISALCIKWFISAQYVIHNISKASKNIEKSRKYPEKVPDLGSERAPFASRKGSFCTPKGPLSQIKCTKIVKSDVFSRFLKSFSPFFGFVSL